MKKVISVLLILCMALSLSACNKNSDEKEDGGIIQTVKIVSGENEYSIRFEDNNLYYYEGDKRVQTVDNSYTHDKFIELPEATDTSNLDSIPIITDNVYKADLKLTSNYINFLKQSGLVESYTAYTSRYIECYLSNPTANNYVRLIATPDYLVVTNEQSLPEIDIRNYLFK